MATIVGILMVCFCLFTVGILTVLKLFIDSQNNRVYPYS